MNRKPFRVIIAGSRSFRDYSMLAVHCDRMLSRVSDRGVVVVSGHAFGADRMGEKYALERHYRIDRFIPDWSGQGKRAGIIRNELMADNADALIAFWDGRSRGTAHMIECAKSKGLKVSVKMFEPDSYSGYRF